MPLARDFSLACCCFDADFPVVVSVSTAAAVSSSSSIVSGSAMVSLAVVLVLLVVSLVIAVVLAARHDEKKFVLFQRGGNVV